ncbi:hypothetical protein T492DRAFT_883490 [Pavlovales sp. CCMP2436]|nr:hypothetical protein T492DRAFT_883490 [Pavlovales sp. CCMP2436]
MDPTLAAAASAVLFTNLLFVVAVAARSRVEQPLPRASMPRLNRSTVIEEVVYSLSDREFKRSYRMDKATFRFVLYHISPYLEDAQGSNHRGDEIDPGVALAITLTWLRGGRCMDAAGIHRLKVPTMFKYLWLTIRAINVGLKYELCFPIDDVAALRWLERDFRARWGARAGGIYRGCVGAIDGIIIKICRSSRFRHRTPLSFFCGRYKCFGIAFQRMVDANCRFL